MNRLYTALIGLCCVTACDLPREMVTNTQFDLWCDNIPCGWEAQGKVERVPTWHPKDWAASLESDDAVLSQLNESANESNTGCISFTLVAKVKKGTRVFLELDFLDDGEIEVSQRLPESDWEERVFRFNPPTWFNKVRFIFRKEGGGEAILGRFEAQAWRGLGPCSGEPVELNNRPNGANCERDEQCEEGGCGGGTCGRACSRSEDCETGEVCGMTGSYHVPPIKSLFSFESGYDTRLLCGTPGHNSFGAACIGGEECETGICCHGVCSICCDEPICEPELGTQDPSGLSRTCPLDPCSSEQQCGRANWPSDGAYPEATKDMLPWICSPGDSIGKTGNLCITPSDCESQECRGAGIWCGSFVGCSLSSTEPMDCPRILTATQNAGVMCIVEGGRCQ